MLNRSRHTKLSRQNLHGKAMLIGSFPSTGQSHGGTKQKQLENEDNQDARTTVETENTDGGKRRPTPDCEHTRVGQRRHLPIKLVPQKNHNSVPLFLF